MVVAEGAHRPSTSSPLASVTAIRLRSNRPSRTAGCQRLAAKRHLITAAALYPYLVAIRSALMPCGMK